MAGETGASFKMSKSTIEWVPLPEVNLKETKSFHFGSEDTPLSGYQQQRLAYSSPVLSRVPNTTVTGNSAGINETVVSQDKPETPGSNNLTIMSLGSSSTGQSTQPRPLNNVSSSGTSSEVLSSDNTNPFPIDPTHLDELWKKFLETVMLPKDRSQHLCCCSCHVAPPNDTPTAPPINMPRPLSKPPRFDISPPTNVKPVSVPSRTRIELMSRYDAPMKSEKSHSEPFIPTDSQSHSRSAINQAPFNKVSFTADPKTTTTHYPKITHQITPHQPSHQQSRSETLSPQSYDSKETQTTSTYIHIPIKDSPTLIPHEDGNVESKTLEKVSLQDACRLLKKDFIKNSQQRQEMIKRQAAHRHPLPIINKEQWHSPNTGHPLPSDKIWQPFVPKPFQERPKVPLKELYKQSKKKWSSLPEVKERARQEKCQREAATNRLRARLYQKEVLNKMRRVYRKKMEKRAGYMKCIC